MLWIILAIAGYFFAATANILDKYILSAKIQQPSVYAFFVAVFSLFGFVFVPFGLRMMSAGMFAMAFVSGALFVYGLVFFYKAVRESEISRTAPLLGTFMALCALIYTFLVPFIAQFIFVFANTTQPSQFSAPHPETILAFWLLLIGGFLVAFDLPLRARDIIPGIRNTVSASILLTASLIILKYLYVSDGFVSGFVWSRLGVFFGGLSLLLIPTFRREIIASLHDTSQSRRAQLSIGMWFFANKIIATLGNLCLQYAIFLGPLVVVQALSGIQFAFVFLLALPLSYRFPVFFQEKLFFNDWVQKIVALTLIALGIYFSAQGGVPLFV
jgi:hypothetical protein